MVDDAAAIVIVRYEVVVYHYGMIVIHEREVSSVVIAGEDGSSGG